MDQLRKVAPGQREILGPVTIYRREIPRLYDEYMPLLALWSNWKRFGLPYAGGYMQQPAIWLHVVEAIDIESAKWEEQERANIRRAKDSSQGRGRKGHR